MRRSTPSFIYKIPRLLKSSAQACLFKRDLSIEPEVNLVSDKDRSRRRWPRGRELVQRRQQAGPELGKGGERIISDGVVIEVKGLLWRRLTEGIRQWLIQISIQRKCSLSPTMEPSSPRAWDELPRLRIRRDESSVPRCRKP